MKASKLIEALQMKVLEVGDLEVTADNPLGKIVTVAAYDDTGRSLAHNDRGAEKPTHIHLH